MNGCRENKWFQTGKAYKTGYPGCAGRACPGKVSPLHAKARCQTSFALAKKGRFETRIGANGMLARKPFFLALLFLSAVLAGTVVLLALQGPPEGELITLLQLLGHLHPMLLHLPIGLIIGIFFLELLLIIRPTSSPVEASRTLIVLLCGTVWPTAVFGILLSWQGSYNAELVRNHLWAGIAVTLFSLLLLPLHIRAYPLGRARERYQFRGILLLACAAVGAAGHLGASLTHGSDFVTHFFARDLRDAPKNGHVPTARQVSGYQQHIQPIFDQYCIACHGEEKHESELRLDTFLRLMEGGSTGPAIQAGDRKASLVYTRLMIPLSGASHMPPKGMAQPTSRDVDLIGRWIDQGASPIHSLDPPATPSTVLSLPIRTDASGLEDENAPSFKIDAKTHAEEQPSGESMQTGFSPDKPTTAQKTCMTATCHADYQQKRYLHGPVSLDDCDACHALQDAETHRFALTGTEPNLCTTCHMDYSKGAFVHEALTEGCTTCHDPHASALRSLLKHESVGELCETCHDTGKNLQFLHGPTGAGHCTVCHNPHTSDHTALLKKNPKALCFTCHVFTQEALKTFPFVHEPAQDNCIACHSGHGADNPKMLRTDIPDLCYRCHQSIRDITEHASTDHGPVTEPGGCLTCHDPHATTVKFGLKADPMTLCLTCHNQPVAVSETSVLPAFSEELKGKSFLHGPVAQRDCSGCHQTHGSDHFRLLKLAYPPEFYSPFRRENYALCFSCHPDSVVLSKRTETVTSFRNGNRNLHYVHINMPDRGRTCRSCHQTHASNSPKLIRDTVPFGEWDLPIQHIKTDSGGSCQPGCHVPRGYHRDTPVKNPRSKQENTQNPPELTDDP
jgi:predicted CXXCH cytochrome family protein